MRGLLWTPKSECNRVWQSPQLCAWRNSSDFCSDIRTYSPYWRVFDNHWEYMEIGHVLAILTPAQEDA